jgi:hypothetical protein
MQFQTLAIDSNLRLPTWNSEYIKLGSNRSFDAKRGRFPKGDNEVWANYLGTCLSSDPRHYENERKAFQNATVISDNEIVYVDGELWIVVVRKGNEKSPRCSDPVTFRKIDEKTLTSLTTL